MPRTAQIGAMSLDANLRDVATIVWRKTRRVARAVYGVLGEPVNEDECQHYAEVAACLAFVDCGGVHGEYTTFDWAGKRADLIKRAHHHILQLYRRGDQTYDVDRLPLKRRTEIVVNDQYCWDQWKARAQVGENEAFTRTHLEYDELPEQERMMTEAMLQELGEVLAGALSDKDFNLLREHYFNQRPQRELAEELGLDETAVNVRMHRARARARAALEKLSPTWKELFDDLV